MDLIHQIESILQLHGIYFVAPSSTMIVFSRDENGTRMIKYYKISSGSSCDVQMSKYFFDKWSETCCTWWCHICMDDGGCFFLVCVVQIRFLMPDHTRVWIEKMFAATNIRHLQSEGSWMIIDRFLFLWCGMRFFRDQEILSPSRDGLQILRKPSLGTSTVMYLFFGRTYQERWSGTISKNMAPSISCHRKRYMQISLVPTIYREGHNNWFHRRVYNNMIFFLPQEKNTNIFLNRQSWIHNSPHQHLILRMSMNKAFSSIRSFLIMSY